MNQNAGMAWTVAGVLAVIVVILLAVMAVRWHDAQPKDLSQVLQNGKEDITQVRDQIRKDCAATDDSSKKKCEQDKKDLADILKEFSADVSNSTTTTTAGASMGN